MNRDALWIASENQPKYSNQYLHCANSDTFIMAGDRPLIRFGKRRAMLGTLRFFDEGGRPLDQAPHYVSRIRAGEAGWEIGGVSIRVGAPENAHAAVVRLISDSPVTVRFGGVHFAGEGLWNVHPDVEGSYRTVPFDPAQLGESYHAAPGGFDVTRPDVDEYLKKHTGKSLRLCLRASFPLRDEGGMAAGVCRGEGLLSLSLCEEGQSPLPLPQAFASMESRADRLCASLRPQTPEPRLDAACAFGANRQDGIWYPPRNMHSDMMWNMPYLGWTNRYGNDVRGWHDRTLTELTYYAPFQVTDSANTGAPQDPNTALGCIPAPTSRFYGRGHIDQDQFFYNMQTQFFDQAIHSWRMTGDPKMAHILRPMLELHCEWLDECFDPDGDGGYESVIDTWPTDSVWCDGGAAPEATCYAYRAHRAAADLSRLAGDEQAQTHHQEIAERIRGGFFRLLWSQDKGIAGRCREQGGHGRLLENPWSYSAFLPVDVGLLSDIQAAQSLYYTKWAFQNDRTEHGRRVWHSNHVPAIWSVRWVGGEEQWMLAHAFFLAGLPEDGLDLLRGSVDAGDSVNGREILEGLFGYRPDYPNGRVKIAPSMPFDWRDAQVENSDARLIYHRDENETSLFFRLIQEAEVEVELLVYADEILAVEGGRIAARLPGFGRAKVKIACGRAREGRIVLRTRGERAPVMPLEIDAAPEAGVFLPLSDASAVLRDPQGVAASQEKRQGGIFVRLANQSGHHWLCAETGGDMPMYRVYHLNLSPTRAEQERKARLRAPLPEGVVFHPLDISAVFNCDVRDIYRQKYLSPRPETVSARIGVDGYSPWTFPFWGNSAPEIHLEKRDQVLTRDGAPLRVAQGEKNIAFASLWDNFPDSVSLPVGESARAVQLLLCGTTNPMQSGVENARLTFLYQDGVSEEVPLRNPHEFWSLCPLMAQPSSPEQDTFNDYDYAQTPFCLPAVPPETIWLGENCRAVALRWRLREGVPLQSVTLFAISKEVVIGIMAATLVK